MSFAISELLDEDARLSDGSQDGYGVGGGPRAGSGGSSGIRAYAGTTAAPARIQEQAGNSSAYNVSAGGDIGVVVASSGGISINDAFAAQPFHQPVHSHAAPLAGPASVQPAPSTAADLFAALSKPPQPHAQQQPPQQQHPAAQLQRTPQPAPHSRPGAALPTQSHQQPAYQNHHVASADGSRDLDHTPTKHREYAALQSSASRQQQQQQQQQQAQQSRTPGHFHDRPKPSPLAPTSQISSHDLQQPASATVSGTVATPSKTPLSVSDQPPGTPTALTGSGAAVASTPLSQSFSSGRPQQQQQQQAQQPQQQQDQQRFRRPTLSNSKSGTPTGGVPGSMPGGLTGYPGGARDDGSQERAESIAKSLSTKMQQLVAEFGREDDFKRASQSTATTAAARLNKRVLSTDLNAPSSKMIKPKGPELIYSQANVPHPSAWRPVLVFPEFGNATVTLTTLEIRPFLYAPMSFVLENEYVIEKALPRSYFIIIQQLLVQSSFVFSWPEPDHVFFQEIAGMRKSTYITLKEQRTGDRWELHLKPTKERTNIFGYLCKADDITKVIQERAKMLLLSRKLPLVLDLDDTLVRVVGNAPGRYVPESEIAQVPHRVRDLQDGRKVVLTERVHEFLEWASNFFEISVCSLGDQSYVEMVINVLDPKRITDPKRNIIRGIAYSARAEYVFLSQSGNPRRPPKDLLSLFAFCVVRETGAPVIDPLILDDNGSMWPSDQQDNIIVVRENAQSPVWSVSLFPVVQHVLGYVHSTFFQQLDAWVQEKPAIRGPPPSATACYKEYLRRELSCKIAGSIPMGVGVGVGDAGSLHAGSLDSLGSLGSKDNQVCRHINSSQASEVDSKQMNLVGITRRRATV
ncbi:hypothetical protein BC831DRAFT_423704 [Entophlyctis helioformis]|nr:hypothetical protein BC831DRAFT_423704 [Entophlyctis helioformis]